MWSNQQNKGTRVPLFYDLTTKSKIHGQKFIKFLCCFFGKFKTSKSHSEINRPYY